MKRIPIAVLAAFSAALLIQPAPARAQSAYEPWPDVATIHRAMRAGELTSAVLVERQLARIGLLNPTLNAVIAIDPTAREQARALDRRHAAGDWAGPLHGIPVLIKDNIETRVQPTTAGSLALAGNDTGRDAPLVRRLREAGAVILGKANLSEWANFRSERSSSGWSAIGGQTRNPYDPDRTPCGSSSGSGAAVAAGMAVMAVGTETNGSVVCPASANGLVGIKPTVGLVSRTHVVPISHSQDTAGPMARSVRDAALMLGAMAGEDPADAATADRPDWDPSDLVEHAIEEGLAGKRIGNPPGDAARAMWPALARANDMDPESVTWVNIDANAKLAALKSGSIDATTSFYNIHHIFQRELGDDMGFLAWKDAGLNPYGNSIIVNAEWLAENEDVVRRFVDVTQRAFAACVDDPEPCVAALVEANGALKLDNELQNWALVEELMSDETSRTVALGWFSPERMAADYDLVETYLGLDEPFDITTAYTNDYLDPSIKMPK